MPPRARLWEKRVTFKERASVTEHAMAFEKANHWPKSTSCGPRLFGICWSHIGLMEKKMETRGITAGILGIHWDSGKESGKYREEKKLKDSLYPQINHRS